MKSLLTPWALAFGGMLTIIGLLGSPNLAAWTACVMALPIAVWICGWSESTARSALANCNVLVANRQRRCNSRY